MREIKFRIPHFDNDTKAFAYFSYWGRIDHKGNPSKDCFTSPATSNKTFAGDDQQFTGLLDKNGKEIYEGDLVVCYLDGERIGVVDTVLYNDESGAFEFKRRYTTIKAFLEHDALFDTDIEVIGNIYENKELENA